MRALKSLKNLHFDWPFSCKVYGVWPKKVQRSYLSWGFLKTTNQPTTFHQPPTNWPIDHLSPNTDQPTTDQVHLPLTNWPSTHKKYEDQKIYNKFYMNFWWKDMRSCCKYNIENVNNYFLIKTEMCYWEDKIIESEVN